MRKVAAATLMRNRIGDQLTQSSQALAQRHFRPVLRPPVDGMVVKREGSESYQKFEPLLPPTLNEVLSISPQCKTALDSSLPSSDRPEYKGQYYSSDEATDVS